ncbi:MAG: DUF4132 domain-containing protein [Planctomycetota bacterium]
MQAIATDAAGWFERAQTPEGRAQILKQHMDGPGPGETELLPEGYILPRDEAELPVYALIAQLDQEYIKWSNEQKAFGFTPLKLKALDTGQAILKLSATERLDILRATLARCMRMDAIIQACSDECNEDVARKIFILQEDERLQRIRPSRMRLRGVIDELLMRKLPLVVSDIEALGMWLRAPGPWVAEYYPAASTRVVKALRDYLKKNEPTPAIREHYLTAAKQLASAYEAPQVKAGQTIHELLGEPESMSQLQIIAAVPTLEPVGSPNVLVDLKQVLGLLPKDEPAPEGAGDGEDPAEAPNSGDPFPLWTGSPLADAHADLFATLTRIDEASGACYELIRPIYLEHDKVRALKAELLEKKKQIRGELLDRARKDPANYVLAACERRTQISLKYRGYADRDYPNKMLDLIAPLMRLPAEFSREQAFDRLLCVTKASMYMDGAGLSEVENLERLAADKPLAGGERWLAHQMRCVLTTKPPLGAMADLPDRISKLLDGEAVYLLMPGEHWADRAHADIAKMPLAQREAWLALLTQAYKAKQSKPNDNWIQAMRPLIAALGEDHFREHATAWLPLVRKGLSVPSTQFRDGMSLSEESEFILRGIVWALADAPDRYTPAALAQLLAATVPRAKLKGPTLTKLANACAWTLGELSTHEDKDTAMSALGQLAKLKAQLTYKSTLNMIAKALDRAAERADLTPEELEEIGAPDFGFVSGRRTEHLGDATATLTVQGKKITTHWTNEKGKQIKSPPASVKNDNKDQFKQIKAAIKEAEGMLLAGRERLDTSYLLNKSWPFADWHERYLEHGLIGTVTQRLMWCIDDTPALFVDGKPQDATGKPIKHSDTSDMRLWHPVGRDEDEVVAWRERLESLEITQPFKQAHREVYVLTDAEHNTGIYSNRFASHIVKQHQFNALARGRGWDAPLQLFFDGIGDYPCRKLPAFSLRAEFWIDHAGDETGHNGSYLYLSTDQVRFYHDDGEEPLPLQDIDPLLFSEVMRDVDLFVGVASVGNDPNWEDGGPDGRYRDYWHDYSFGDLGATAQTRKAILSRLVPRLKIADRCTFDDKFLVVRGDKRTYKIHLGSSNILMQPNDQYLCIVPGRGDTKVGDKVFLPFEGDQRLAIILSKAMMLADDTKIKDPTILSQIGR